MAKDRATLGQRHYSLWQAQLPDYDDYFVYVIRAGKKAPVKIGKAKRPLQRLKTLQTGNAQTLRLLLVVPGGEKLERVLHARFADHRLGTSEWFYGPGIKQVIEFVTELAVEMVQAHQEGSWDPPSLGGFPGWTDDERRALEPDRVTIPMTARTVERPAPDPFFVPPEEDFSFVPTIHQRVCRTMLRAPQHNGPCTQ